MFYLLSILLTFIFIFLLAIPFIIAGQSKYFDYLFSKTVKYCKESIGSLISVDGKIRFGKTSLAVALGHVYALISQMQLSDKIREIKIIFKILDFNLIDAFIESSIVPDQVFGIDYNALAKTMFNQLDLSFYGHVNDFINDKSTIDIFAEYIESYVILNIRNNYNVSNISVFNRVTMNYNFKLDPEWLAMNYAFENHNFALENHMTILVDEKSDDGGAAKHYDEAQDQSGRKEFLRKFGQLFRETNHLITTKQNVLDEIKQHRLLTQSNIFVSERVKTVKTGHFMYKLLERFMMTKLLIYRFKTFIKIVFKINIRLFKFSQVIQLYRQYREQYFNLINIERNTLNTLYFWKKLFFYFGYNVYATNVYEDADDVGKKTVGETFQFVIPVRYAFGNYQTHLAYQDYLVLKQTNRTKIVENNPFEYKSKFITDELERGADDDLIEL